MKRLLLSAVLGLLLLACNDDAPGDFDMATPSDSQGTLRPSATPAPGDTPGPIAGAAPAVTGLFTEPRPVEPDQRVILPARPPSPFPAWDRESVMLYDTDRDVATSFGRGRVTSPAFAGSTFVYTSQDNEVWLVSLSTLQRQSLGRGVVAFFLGESHVVINPGDNMFVAVDLVTGDRTAVEALTDPHLKSMAAQRLSASLRASWLDGGLLVRLANSPEEACKALMPRERRICEARTGEEWVVEDVANGQIVLAFQAHKAEPAGPGELVIATTPMCRADDGALIPCYELLGRVEPGEPREPVQREGTTNIFLVDLATGAAEFVATATYSASSLSWPSNWPLASDHGHVVWTESFCGQPPGNTRVFSRSTGRLVELDKSLWVTLREGRIGTGWPGARELLDASTFAYIAVLPESLSSVSWSYDLRYAAVGMTLGHGGLCG